MDDIFHPIDRMILSVNNHGKGATGGLAPNK